MKSSSRLLISLILSASALTHPCYADPAPESVGQEIWRDLASPVITPAWIPLVAGSGATLVLYGFKYEIDDPLQQSWSIRKPLGSWSQYGNDLGQWVPN